MDALAAIGADQPGMGMTNRVLPAQGEERGASMTLIWLDGDALRKFQSLKTEFKGPSPTISRILRFCASITSIRTYFALNLFPARALMCLVPVASDPDIHLQRH